MINAAAEKLKGLFKRENRTKFLIIMLISVAMLIFISEMLSDGETVNESTEAVGYDIDTVTLQTEERMEKILENINGVGKVEVMVTFEGGVKNTYAVERATTEELSENQDGDKEERNEISEKYIIIDNGNGEEALIEYFTLPKVSGVVVVCDGGGSTAVRERVISAVTTALNIGSDRVYVTQRN